MGNHSLQKGGWTGPGRRQSKSNLLCWAGVNRLCTSACATKQHLFKIKVGVLVLWPKMWSLLENSMGCGEECFFCGSSQSVPLLSIWSVLQITLKCLVDLGRAWMLSFDKHGDTEVILYYPYLDLSRLTCPLMPSGALWNDVQQSGCVLIYNHHISSMDCFY